MKKSTPATRRAARHPRADSTACAEPRPFKLRTGVPVLPKVKGKRVTPAIVNELRDELPSDLAVPPAAALYHVRMKKTPAESGLQAVEDYFSAVIEPARTTLLKVRAIIRAAVPAEATEGISYGIPMFKYKGVLLGLGAFKDHCSFFLGTSSLGAELSDNLKNYSISKGTIRFPVDRPMPATLVRKIVKLRVQQNESKKSSKR